MMLKVTQNTVIIIIIEIKIIIITTENRIKTISLIYSSDIDTAIKLL